MPDADRKICVVTTSRADYGLLKGVMKEINDAKDLELQVIASAMHLKEEFGYTYKNIEADGFEIDAKIDMLSDSDSIGANSEAIGKGIKEFTDVYSKLKPDIVVVLGDRFELMSAVIPAVMMKIPTAHIHGGETSEGAIDEYIRHAVTKLSVIHFPATDEYRQRIINMGENPSNVFNFGAPGLDALKDAEFLSRNEIMDELGFTEDNATAIVTYHPVTIEERTVENQIEQLLEAVKECGINAVFTKANADTGGRLINERLKEFCESDTGKYKFRDNLGNLYLSCLKNLDVMIGNSSSGITEAPSFKMPVVNIGARQDGRIKAKNVIDTGYTKNEIVNTVSYVLSDKFRELIKDTVNPYWNGGNAGRKITNVLKEIDLNGILRKKFHDRV